MLLAGLGLLAGCATRTGPGSGSASSAPSYRPATAWPQTYQRPVAVGAATPVAPPPPRVAAPAPAVAAASPSMPLMSRSTWTRSGPVGRNINPMNGVSRITVHHEGWTVVNFTDARSVINRLEDIRGAHVRDRKWADIGYHFIVDRSGQIWEGRNIRYQGAHVSQNNENNVGIMLLGNFERQSPTTAQLDGLRLCLRSLMKTYNVPVRRVFTHRELMPTACPGKSLQPRIQSLRSNGYLA